MVFLKKKTQVIEFRHYLCQSLTMKFTIIKWSLRVVPIWSVIFFDLCKRLIPPTLLLFYNEQANQISISHESWQLLRISASYSYKNNSLR